MGLKPPNGGWGPTCSKSNTDLDISIVHKQIIEVIYTLAFCDILLPIVRHIILS